MAFFEGESRGGHGVVLAEDADQAQQLTAAALSAQGIDPAKLSLHEISDASPGAHILYSGAS